MGLVQHHATLGVSSSHERKYGKVLCVVRGLHVAGSARLSDAHWCVLLAEGKSMQSLQVICLHQPAACPAGDATLLQVLPRRQHVLFTHGRGIHTLRSLRLLQRL